MDLESWFCIAAKMTDSEEAAYTHAMKNRVPLIFALLLSLLSSCNSSKSWRDASRESAQIAVPAAQQKEAIFQIYHARAFSWRGYFGSHPWVAWKRPEDKSYTVAHVVGWRVNRGQPAVLKQEDLPDRLWFDSMPVIHDQIEGEKALVVIDQVEKLIESYPYQNEYRLWPGPNSNTFVEFLIRNIPELRLGLPSHAIGKDYLGPSQFLSRGPSGSGAQFSVLGAFGLSVGVEEGIELNLFALNFGLDFWTPALKLPFVGRLGFKDKAVW